MHGLTIMQEAALAAVYLRQDELPAMMTELGLTKQLLALQDQGMLKMQSDWGGTLALVQSFLPEGAKHYNQVRSARRRFVPISDEADQLLDLIYGEAKAAKNSNDQGGLTYHEGRDEDYRELSRHELIKVMWADNKPYHVDVTDTGWSYAEGWFLDQEKSMEINIAPTFNNNANSTSSAEANAAAVNVTLGSTIQQIQDLDIADTVKGEIRSAVEELEQAAKKKDRANFLGKLEKVSSIAKSSVDLAKIVIPFITTAIGSFS